MQLFVMFVLRGNWWWGCHVIVVDDLEEEDSIEHQRYQKADQNHNVAHLLQRCEHARSIASELHEARDEAECPCALVVVIGEDLRDAAVRKHGDHEGGEALEQIHGDELFGQEDVIEARVTVQIHESCCVCVHESTYNATKDTRPNDFFW